MKRKCGYVAEDRVHVGTIHHKGLIAWEDGKIEANVLRFRAAASLSLAGS